MLLLVVLSLVVKGAWADEDSSSSGSSSSKEITYVCWDGTPGYATYGYGEDPTSLFLSESERKNGDKWCCAQSLNPYVIFEASEGGKLKGYTITTGNDNSREGGRNPRNWTLYGSKDYGTAENPTWEEITTVTDDNKLEDYDFRPYEYKLDEPSTKYYRYFKWVISANKGAEAMQVSELKLDLETCPHEKDGNSTLTYIKDVEANCKWAAHKLYHCSLCDLDVKDFTGTELGPHDLVYVPATATCQQRGHEAYYLCKICKRMYKDAQGTEDFYRMNLEDENLKYGNHHFVDGYCTVCGKGEIKTSGDFQYTINKNTQEVTIVKYTGSGNEVTIPSEIEGKKVTTIGAGSDNSGSSSSEDMKVFPNNSYFRQITIPSTVTVINAYAFCRTDVSKVTFEEDGTASTKNLTIAENAFGSSYLKTIELPARTLSIGDNAFAECRLLTDVSLKFKPTDEPSTTIGNYIFGYPDYSSFPRDLVIKVDEDLEETYKSMEGLSIYKNYINRKIYTSGGWQYTVNEDGQTVTILNYEGQGGDVVIPATLDGKNVTVLGERSFLYNATITSVTIPASIETIDKQAFSGCNNLKNVDFAENGLLKTIENSAFYGCRITDVTLPASVTSIGNQAFDGVKVVNMLGETAPNMAGYRVFGYSSDYVIYVASEEIANNFRGNSSWTEYYYADKIKVKEGGFSSATITDENESSADCPLAAKTYEAEKLVYKRHFNEAGQYATICLPFSVSTDQTADVFEGVWTFTDKDVKFVTRNSEGRYTLHFSANGENEGLKANQPYYVKLKSNVQEVNFTNKEAEKVSLRPSTLEAKVYDEASGEEIRDVTINVYGNFRNLTYGNYYTFNTDGTFGRSSYVYPYRMYLTITTDEIYSAPVFFSIGTGGSATTGINAVTASGSKVTDGKVYNLSGQLVNAKGEIKGLPKGIYVKDGKKFVVK